MAEEEVGSTDISALAERLESDSEIVVKNAHLLAFYLIIMNQEEINTLLMTALGQLLQNQREDSKVSFERATRANSRLQRRVDRLFKDLLQTNQPGTDGG